ncbi:MULTISPECIES: hypothetical protein [unclassified Bradyrhizobium]|uniref:hypothetical protein n=1 Tax=unclassified Bradyrhizobium TaxID=2631580 RepID=UPI0020B40174|nr:MULTISPECIES: hypothetical protein [unclassified Bradyrhizobium]MCP3396953.1 hypothetical protein [Bradyrhizobium sp. CCGB20]MCP3405468.1 hypothetical protein [Bradyrhizobium sp. CCGB01]
MRTKESTKRGQSGQGKHEFFVVNLTKKKLKGHVLWRSSGNEIKLDVNGLEPGKGSLRKQFYPSSGSRNYWRWSHGDGEYQLNCDDGYTYAIVTISDHGIRVLATDTSPDTWKW